MKIRSLLLFTLLHISIFNMYAQIPYENRHSQVVSDAWVSNIKTISPNTSRGSLHWIRYDLGDTYALEKMKIWNINTPGMITAGAQSIIIDYSIDGNKWNEWGRFSLQPGDGTTIYQGQDGPNFGGLTARYVLINVISNFGHPTEAGIAEIKINVSPITTDVKETLAEDWAKISAYPNPFSDETTIDIENLANDVQTNYQLSDINGRVIFTKPITDKSFKLDAKNLTTGIYTLSLIHSSGKKSIQLNVIK